MAAIVSYDLPTGGLTSTTVQLKHEPHTTSILLGPEIGTAKLPHDRTLRVAATGRTVRFTIDGIDGHVDVDLGALAYQAALLLTEEVAAE